MDKYKITLRRKNPGICQICLNPGHWSYECEKKRAYLYRPSALTRYKNKIDKNENPTRQSKKPPKYRSIRRDRRRFGYQESSDSSDSSDSDQEEQEIEEEQQDEHEQREDWQNHLTQQEMNDLENRSTHLKKGIDLDEVDLFK